MRTKRELPSIRQIRQSVGDLLAEKERRMTLILAQILLLLFVALYISIAQAFGALQMLSAVLLHAWLNYLLYALYLVINAAVSVFFVLPTVIGFLQMAALMERDETVALTDLFAVFSKRALYREALGISWRAFWRVALTVIAVKTTVSLSTYFFAGSLPAGIICGIIVLLELLGGLWLILHGFSLVADLCTASQPLRRARAAATGGFRVGVHYFAGFLPWLLLGVLSFGILLVWEVLPCMAVGYFRYCRELQEQNLNIHSEEYKDE